MARYKREDFERSLIYRIKKADCEPHFANGKIHFEIKLAPGAVWYLCTDIIPVIDGERREPRIGCRRIAAGDHETQERDRRWRDGVTHIETSNVVVRKSFEQSVYDIGALRLDIGGDGGPGCRRRVCLGL